MDELLPDGEDEVAGTVFRDMTMLALAGFVAIVMLLLPWLNPEAEDETTTMKAPGRVMVELFWPDDRDADVDLWVEAPGDTLPVGYPHMDDYHFNLLRDDRGTTYDATPINYEIAYTRGIAAGEYTVNVSLYAADPDDRGPVPAEVAVSVIEPDMLSRKVLVTRTITLSREGEEITATRFKLDQNGKLVEGSENDLQKSLIRAFSTHGAR